MSALGFDARTPSEQQLLPRVSVAISSYNYGRYLRACIDSALSQSGIDLEVVIVDDASGDDSAAIAHEYARRDPRVRVIVHEQNQGHIATFNEALEFASGDFVVKLDSDDMLTPGALARGAEVLLQHPAVGMVYGNPLTFVEGDPPPARTRVTGLRIWPGGRWVERRCEAARNCIMQPEVMVRRSVLSRVGGHREHVPAAHDLNLWLRIAAISDVARIKGVDQGFYRVHADSLLRSRFGGPYNDLIERRKAYVDFFETYTGDNPAVTKWERVARRSLAKQALQQARVELESGVAQDRDVEQFLEYAAETYPDSSSLRDWRIVQRGKTAGSVSTRPWLAVRRAVREVGDRVRWRRWRRYGI